MNFLYSSN